MRFLTILAALAGSVYLVFKFLKFKFLLAEDRPEIRVRNRKLTIENDEKNWIALDVSNKQWKMDHSEGYSVESYQVIVFNSKNDCGPLAGNEVLISLEINNDVHVFKFHLVESTGINEPVVTSPVELRHRSLSWKKKLKIKDDPEARITKIDVNGKQCSFPGDPEKEVRVKLQMIYKRAAI